ncbi:hypothetical protein B0H14DRAFT_3604247 [Mycena olivaceomarginata]|nr:hypothetical protein B0H14DRAFT_3604247 [Mycena olivaceomarginata]
MSGEPPLFRPFRLFLRLFLRLPLRPPLRLMPPTFRPPVLIGMCYTTRPMIIVSPSVGILILSSLRIPPLEPPPIPTLAPPFPACTRHTHALHYKTTATSTADERHLLPPQISTDWAEEREGSVYCNVQVDLGTGRLEVKGGWKSNLERRQDDYRSCESPAPAILWTVAFECSALSACCTSSSQNSCYRLAAVLAEVPGTPAELEGFPASESGSSCLPRTEGYPVPFLQLSTPVPDAHLHLQAHTEDDKDTAADLSGLAYMPWAPREVVREREVERRVRLWESKSKRSTKSKSSTTSSTLASLPPGATSFPHSPSFPHDPGVEFGAFAFAQDDFDGTQGGPPAPPDELGVEVDVAENVEKAEVVREMLLSPGLSRGAGGFRFGNDGGGRREGDGDGWVLSYSAAIRFSDSADGWQEVIVRKISYTGSEK